MKNSTLWNPCEASEKKTKTKQNWLSIFQTDFSPELMNKIIIFFLNYDLQHAQIIKNSKDCLIIRVPNLKSIFTSHIMINNFIYPFFQSSDSSNCCTIHATFIHSHTHSYTYDGGCHARRQLLIMSYLGFSILLKDTSTCN